MQAAKLMKSTYTLVFDSYHTLIWYLDGKKVESKLVIFFFLHIRRSFFIFFFLRLFLTNTHSVVKEQKLILWLNFFY